MLSGCDAWLQARGTVRDISGKPVPGATVSFKSENDSRTFRTDSDGRYLVSIWQWPSRIEYKLTVAKIGFVPYEKQVKGPGLYQNLDVVLIPLSTDSGSPQAPVTPQGIAKAMFPNAPQKAKKADCFRALTRNMSVNMAVEKCGRPDEEVGSSIYIFVWDLDDGSTVSIGTPYLERIDYLLLTDTSGKKSLLLGNY